MSRLQTATAACIYNNIALYIVILQYIMVYEDRREMSFGWQALVGGRVI